MVDVVYKGEFLKTRIYLDTSVIGGCFDKEFSLWSRKLFDEIHQGQKVAVISDLTLDEISGAPQEVRDFLSRLSQHEIEYVTLVDECAGINPGIFTV